MTAPPFDNSSSEPPEDTPLRHDFAAAEVRPEALETLSRALDPSRGASVTRDAAESYARGVEQDLHAIDSERRPPTLKSTQSRAHLGTILGSVALMLAVIGGAFLWRAEHGPLPTQRYHTVPGQRSTIHLANGSTILLAPATTVTVSPTGIDVVGEAQFSVTANSSRPFAVHTRNTMVRVLGTRFMVRQYADESMSRVVVEDGKVMLQPTRHARTNDAPTLLTARMLAEVTDSGITVTPNIVTDTYTGWTRGTLVFDKIPLRTVAAELSRVYGVGVRVADSVLANKVMILDVSVAEQSLSQVLDIVGQAANARSVFDGQTYVLSPGYPQARMPRRIPDPQLEKQYGR